MKQENNIMRVTMPLKTKQRIYSEDIHHFANGKLPYFQENIKKAIVKCTRFPLEYSMDFKGKSGNSYRLYTVVKDKKTIYRDGIILKFVCFFPSIKGICCYFDPSVMCDGSKPSFGYDFRTGIEFEGGDQKQISAHLIEQYGVRFERMKKRNGLVYYKDAYDQFFFRNLFMSDFYTIIISGRDTDFRDYDCITLCYDGLIFGEGDTEHSKSYRYNTYMSFETRFTSRQKTILSTLLTLRKAMIENGSAFHRYLTSHSSVTV